MTEAFQSAAEPAYWTRGEIYFVNFYLKSNFPLFRLSFSRKMFKNKLLKFQRWAITAAHCLCSPGDISKNFLPVLPLKVTYAKTPKISFHFNLWNMPWIWLNTALRPKTIQKNNSTDRTYWEKSFFFIHSKYTLL